MLEKLMTELVTLREFVVSFDLLYLLVMVLLLAHTVVVPA